MAITSVTPIKAKLNGFKKYTLTAASSASDGFNFQTKGLGDEIIVVVAANTHASAAKKITVKKPSKAGYASVTADDELSLAAGETAFLRIETAKVANTDGTVVLIPESTDVKIAVLA
ncbi:MAG: hypothetical protein MJZ37_06460 [Bacilli bacterium]|nr:hypothetical protein [Bacilli bacterium]